MISDDDFEWLDKLPYFSFPPDWKVKISPNFGGSIVRFRVKKREDQEDISVYFDAHNVLGCCQGPYWEAYPINGTTDRFLLGQEDELIKAIDMELSK